MSFEAGFVVQADVNALSTAGLNPLHLLMEVLVFELWPGLGLGLRLGLVLAIGVGLLVVTGPHLT